MATLKRTVLGIEIGSREIRMVEMRGGNPPQVVKAGSVTLPDKAVDGDRIAQIEAVAELIRGLHQRLGCQSRSVVVGMGVQGIVTRMMDIPRVPDSELRIVLEGELAHYQILRSGAGAFDYFRLNNPGLNDDELPQVVLMAVEDRVAQGYRQVVERAGLQLLALEPITLSLFRAAYPLLRNEPAALCLSITPQRSELGVLDGGQLRIYRRIDLGSNDFVRGRKTVAPPIPGVSLDLSLDLGTPAAAYPQTEVRPARTLLNMDMGADTDELAEGFDTGELRGAPRRSGTGYLNQPGEAAEAGGVIPQVANSLANEIQRSLDYYQRVFPNATAITRIILSANDPEAAAVAPLLSQNLNMDVRIVEPPVDGNLSAQTRETLSAPQGLQYLGAIGLALHALSPDLKQIPRFNLSVTGHTAAPAAERDRITAVMVTAACFLLGGLFAGFYIRQKANGENEKLEIMRRDLGFKLRDSADIDKRINDNMALGWIVKSDNMPAAAVMNQVTVNLPPGVGLSTMNIERNGEIVLDGTAQDMQEFNLFYFNLATCPRFVGVHFPTLQMDPVTRIVTFHMQMALKGTQAAETGTSGSL